jgi:hypothetical protein
MGRRLKFECYSCHETYTLYREDEGLSKLSVQCPYCLTEAVADLSPYANDVVTIFRSPLPSSNTEDEPEPFPEIIRTSPSE